MSVFSRVASVVFAVAVLIAGAAPGPAILAGPAVVVAPAPQAPSQPDIVQGSQPFLTILCKLAGVTVEPEPTPYFRDLVSAPADGLSAYWHEVSFGNINLDGSAVIGWRDLPGDPASYRNSNGNMDFERLASDCITRSHPGPDRRKFAGLSLVFNVDLDPHPRAGVTCVGAGATRDCYKAIWMWPAWLRSEAAWAHEMGHVFGLPHSSDPSGVDYANVWDVMSGFTGCACGHDHNSVPQHPIAYQLDRLGWIPAAKKYAASSEGEASIRLERTSQPASGDYLMAQVPTVSADIYYTVEARGRVGFDEHIPGAAVLIHEVDRKRPDQPARLVVAPNAGPLTAASGMWLPGSRFVDAKNRVSIQVEAETASGFGVSIRTGSAALAPAAGDVSAQAARSPFAEVSSSEWPVETSLLALAAGARQQVYVVSAQATSLGMSPSIQVSRLDGSEWRAAQRLPSGWSNMTGDAPAVVTAHSGAAVVAWSGSDHAFATMSAGASATADIWLAQQGASGEWNPPVRIDDDPGRNAQLSPALAIDGRDRIEASWEDARNGDSDIYFAEVTGGRGAANRRVNDDPGKAPQGAPAVAVHSEGIVEVLWVDLRSGVSEIYEARRTAGGEWSANARLASAGIDVFAAPAVTVDEAGNFYAAWIAYPACTRAKGETGSLMAAVRPKGGSWGVPVVVRTGLAGGKESRPVITADSGGRVYLAWEERAGSGISVYLATRTALGRWSEPQSVAGSPTGRLGKPALTVDAAGQVYLANVAANANAAHLTIRGTSR